MTDGQGTDREGRALTVATVFIAVILAGYVLYAARALFVPFAIAVMVWYIINALTQLFCRLRIRGRVLPYWLRLTFALVAIAIAIHFMIELVSANVNQVAQAAPLYAANLHRIVSIVSEWFGLPAPSSLRDIISDVDVGPWIGTLASALSSLAGNVGLIVVYVLFLLIAQNNWQSKLDALFPNSARRARVVAITTSIQEEIRSYISIKTLVSILTGVVSYVVLAIVGVDFASFWAFVIFLLNYIPNIGSVLGVIFPAALTLVQFGEPAPFLIVTLGLGTVQFLIGNILEPRLQGVRLGLDPVVLILSLIAWGLMWGIAGMFLAVPLTVIAMIVMSNFKGTRAIAILMSTDGRLK